MVKEPKEFKEVAEVPPGPLPPVEGPAASELDNLIQRVSGLEREVEQLRQGR